MRVVPQFDPAVSGTETAVTADVPLEVTIPLLPGSRPAKYVSIAATNGAAVRFKVGLVGVDASSEPHAIISRESGPLIINVAGNTTIDVLSTASGAIVITPLANQ